MSQRHLHNYTINVCLRSGDVSLLNTKHANAVIPLGMILPGVMARTNGITGIATSSRPHLFCEANRRRFSLRGGRAIQVTSGRKKNRRGRGKNPGLAMEFV